MPWDGTRLMTARLDGDRADRYVKQVFGAPDLPVFQPEFSPDGRYLAFLANDGEWDTLYTSTSPAARSARWSRDASLMEPAWEPGHAPDGLERADALLPEERKAAGARSGRWTQSSQASPNSSTCAPYTWINAVGRLARGRRRVALIGSSPRSPTVSC
jgi:hypothetical protein